MNTEGTGKIGEVTPDMVASVVLAFAADPFARWMLPGPEQFVIHFTELTRIHGRRCAENGGAFADTDGRGAAFWYPPEIPPDAEAIGGQFKAAGVAERVAPMWQRVAGYEPEEPHWYLRQIGVDPRLQGDGRGSRLMEVSLAEIDRRGGLAYLEATSEPSRAFYERHDFEVLDEVRVGDSAPLWPMTRSPR